MITEIEGNIFSDIPKEDENRIKVMIHGCNCFGGMGAGIALEVKNRYPHVYEEYRKQYEESGLQLGQIIPVVAQPNFSIINAMTQYHWRRKPNEVVVDYAAVRECFKATLSYIEHLTTYYDSIVTLEFPLIGCGLAGGDWNIISKIIDEEIPDTIPKILWIYKG